MSDIKERIDTLVEDLQEERDELRVQIHLARLEASDEWQDIEKKMGKLRTKAGAIGEATAESSKEIGVALSLLGEEIRDGFRRIARRL